VHFFFLICFFDYVVTAGDEIKSCCLNCAVHLYV
jgi:hypothetical protein